VIDIEKSSSNPLVFTHVEGWHQNATVSTKKTGRKKAEKRREPCMHLSWHIKDKAQICHF